MNIAFNFKNFDPSDHLKTYAASRFEKLAKYIPDSDAAEIQVNLSVEKFRQMADVVLNAPDLHISAYDESEDMYATIDLVFDKVQAQVKKFREKRAERRRGERSVRMEVISFATGETGERDKTIVASDSYSPKPMDVDEAAEQLESLGYEFLVFLNSETDRVNVIYRRDSGDFGLIDPGM